MRSAFNNYFPSKEAAIVAAVAWMGSAPLLPNVQPQRASIFRREWPFLSPFQSGPTVLGFPGHAPCDHPSLLQEQNRTDLEVVRQFADIVADHQSNATDDIYPMLLASILVAAVRVGMSIGFESSPTRRCTTRYRAP